MLSRKMLTSVDVAGCFAHAAFVMVQWRMCLNCLFVNIVAVVGAGTGAGAREGELVSGHSGGHG